MIRFSQETFVRHWQKKDGDVQSLVCSPRTGACTIMVNAEPFLTALDWKPQTVEEVVRTLADDFGMRPEDVAGDVREFIELLASYGFATTEDTENAEITHAEPQGAQRGDLTQRHEGTEAFDAEGNAHDDDWTPLDDFFRENGLPTQLHLDLTAACTERCVHCYLPDYPNKHIPFELAEKALREFRAMQGLTVHLTGGECMLHPDFERVCGLCRDLNLNFVILSNMTACDERRIAFLAEVQPQFINVSLYSMDEREHDAITQLPGSWRRTMAAILACEEAGVPIRLAAPLLKENRKAFGMLARFAQEHRMHLIPSIDIVPQSDHDCSNLDHACSAAELREALAANPDIFDRGWDLSRRVDADAKLCDIGLSRLYLNSFGNYYPCDSMHGYVLGNAATDTFESVWRGEKLEKLRRLANRDFPQCLACANRPVCKVCPAFNFNATGDIFKTTPAKCAVAAVVREVYGKA